MRRSSSSRARDPKRYDGGRTRGRDPVRGTIVGLGSWVRVHIYTAGYVCVCIVSTSGIDEWDYRALGRSE